MIRADGTCEELPIGSLAAGIEPNIEYALQTNRLYPNDLFVAYTDGVPDMMNFQSERFGKARLFAMLHALYEEDKHASATIILGRIVRELRQFAGLHIRPDDTTIIVARYLGTR